jgi:hypothetical protein
MPAMDNKVFTVRPLLMVSAITEALVKLEER